jgi:voltage-gated potassium channel
MILLADHGRHAYFLVMRILRGEWWFPHVPLALLVMYGSLCLLRQDLGQNWTSFYKNAETGEIIVAPQLAPLVLIGGGMALFGVGLMLRSRIVWVMTVLLVLGATISTVLGRAEVQINLLIYFALTLAGLLLSWRRFNRTGLAASTLFALTAIAMVVFYATFGSFYLGQHFKPPITDLVTAFYYAIVTMATVGYGDITPVSPEAKLFTVSVITLGVAVFATSLTAIITPLVNNSLNRIVLRKDRPMERSKHYIVVGGSALAINTARELMNRGCPVTRILKSQPEGDVLKNIDIVIGDASDTAVLREAGAEKAECVLAMKSDDSENAFIVLAVKELGDHVRTVVAINDTNHIDRVRLVQPDVIIAPEVLGGELIAMMLSGETVTPEFLMERIFQKVTAKKKKGTAAL